MSANVMVSFEGEEERDRDGAPCRSSMLKPFRGYDVLSKTVMAASIVAITLVLNNRQKSDNSSAL